MSKRRRLGDLGIFYRRDVAEQSVLRFALQDWKPHREFAAWPSESNIEWKNQTDKSALLVRSKSAGSALETPTYWMKKGRFSLGSMFQLHLAWQVCPLKAPLQKPKQIPGRSITLLEEKGIDLFAKLPGCFVNIRPDI